MRYKQPLSNAVLRLEHIWKIYSLGESEVYALRDISLSVFSGEFLAVIGPSGSGKSTLLHIMGLLDVPTRGRVIIDGIDASKLDDNQLSALRNKKIGFVFQSFNLISALTAVENVEVPMALAGVPKEVRRERAIKLLEKLGLGNRLFHKPVQLSGGQQQRVAIARALANNPEIILADEPTGNLDSKSGKAVMEIFKRLHQEGRTLVVVTHDPNVADYAERLIYIRDGKITDEVKK